MQFVKKNEILKEREMTSKDSGLIFSITVISMFIASLAFIGKENADKENGAETGKAEAEKSDTDEVNL